MADWGTSEGWGGNRLRPTVTRAFFPSTIRVSNPSDLTTGIGTAYKDERALIYGASDRTLSIPNIGKFKEGYSALKFTNVRADGGGIVSIKSSGTAAAGSASYTEITGTTKGSGHSSKFSVNRSNGTYDVTITTKGFGYKMNDTIVVLGSALGGVNGVNNLNIVVTSAIITKDPKYVDMDYPFMRKAEANLIYAEAVLRGGNKVDGLEALTAFNELRTRAKAKLLTTTELTVDYILTERVREFFMEGHRRTDLIRFNKFGGATGYTWEWKSGEQAGADFPVEYNLFPLPTNDLNANPNLVQNPGY
jgi:hypothetical protein